MVDPSGFPDQRPGGSALGNAAPRPALDVPGPRILSFEGFHEASRLRLSGSMAAVYRHALQNQRADDITQRGLSLMHFTPVVWVRTLWIAIPAC